MSDPISAVAGTAKDIVLHADKFTPKQRWTVLAMIGAFVFSLHWVWLARLDCKLGIKSACAYIETVYEDPMFPGLNF